MITILVFSSLIVGGLSHGRLLFPTTRYGAIYGSGAYENNPVSGSDGVDFACRNDPQQDGSYPAENSFTAGQQMNIRWGLSAEHVGDCALYISYDYYLSGANKAYMEFFKIAQWEDCKSINNQDNAITLPDWVPAGRAVFRWDWVALHVYPTLEFYTQCADAQIVSSSGNLPQDIPSYSAVGLYPVDSSNGEFRNPWGGSSAPYFITGSPCACADSPDNGCPLVADPSGAGYISVGTLAYCGGDPTATQRPTTERLQTDPPTVSAVPSPTSPAVPSPTSPVVPSPTQPNDGSCPSECATCNTWGGLSCTDWCSKWGYCGYTNDHIVEGTDCRGCGSSPAPPTPTADPTSPPAPTADPTNEPTPAPVVNPTEASCASGNDLEKRTGVLVKRMKTECECQEKCAEDANTAIYAYLEDKEHCFCIGA